MENSDLWQVLECATIAKNRGRPPVFGKILSASAVNSGSEHVFLQFRGQSTFSCTIFDASFVDGIRGAHAFHVRAAPVLGLLDIDLKSALTPNFGEKGV
jgi:hypothetical protein